MECNGQDSPGGFASFSPLDLTNVVYEDDATLRSSADNPRKQALLEGMRGR